MKSRNVRLGQVELIVPPRRKDHGYDYSEGNEVVPTE